MSIKFLLLSILFLCIVQFNTYLLTQEIPEVKTTVLTAKKTLRNSISVYEVSMYFSNISKDRVTSLWKSENPDDITLVCNLIEKMQEITNQKDTAITNFEKYKRYAVYRDLWGMALGFYTRHPTNNKVKKEIVEAWQKSPKNVNLHSVALLDYCDNILFPKEKIETIKSNAWKIVAKTNNLGIWESFCQRIQGTYSRNNFVIGDKSDIEKLEIYIKHLDMEFASSRHAANIASFAKHELMSHLNIPINGIPSLVVLHLTVEEIKELGPIIFLDEKTIKEREEAKTAGIRAIAEAPEMAKRLMIDEPGRLKAMNIIGNIQEPEQVRKEMKFALCQYYGIRVNQFPNVKATPKEVQKISELLKTENEQVTSDILDILSAAQCVSLIPDLFEICYSKKIPPYRGFGTIAIAPKKTVYFQYSPTQIISYLGDEQVIPELEKLANSATVSEEMKQDALLAINRIKRRKAEEQEQLKRNEETKRLLAERKIFVAEAGGPTDVKMNPFYDPTRKPDDSQQGHLLNSRTWTSLEGWFTQNAVLIRKDKNNVVLKRDEDNKEITVPINRLSIQDQNYIQTWKPPQK
ncbi:MAG: hypothetical protein LBC02_08240 [Planctomycetaceae bacterium]|jgi:hypothetical protein|nr:hypothetical protein [Planctomycetaceae bacterium]